MPRIFIAIPIDEAVCTALGALRKRDAPGFRWVADDQYHITLRFLGDVTETQASMAGEAVADATNGWTDSIYLSAKGLGAFPNPTRARVVWAGLEGDVSHLKRLQERVEARLIDAGFPAEDRPFRPHITMARLRSPAPVAPLLHTYTGHTFGSWSVNQVQVIESVLQPQGPQYRVRREISLGL